MAWTVVFDDIEGVEAELRCDAQLLDLSRSHGVEFAGQLLAKRVEPDVDDFSVLPYWKNFKKEFFEVICTESDKYESLRKELAESKRTARWVVFTVATAIGATISVPAVVLSPFVALAILGSMRIGVEAWCTTKREAFELADGAPVLLAMEKASSDVHLRFDLGVKDHGWTHGFADYPEGDEGEYELVGGPRDLPGELGPGRAYYIQGNNHSDDLFMYLKRRLSTDDGIVPNQEYALDFRVTFASNAPSGCIGAGGPPGEAVVLKVGAWPVEPDTTVIDGYRRMNLDKGHQSKGGVAASVAGNIANGTPCPEDGSPVDYVKLVRDQEHSGVQSNANGELWLLVGTDSGFEALTALYYLAVEVLLTGVSNASEEKE